MTHAGKVLELSRRRLHDLLVGNFEAFVCLLKPLSSLVDLLLERLDQLLILLNLPVRLNQVGTSHGEGFEEGDISLRVSTWLVCNPEHADDSATLLEEWDPQKVIQRRMSRWDS